jgi:hypothetical protein
MPEQHRTGEPEYPQTIDRLFSELPVTDRWRLVKAALIDLRPEYPPFRFRSLRTVLVICASSSSIVLLMLSSKHVPISGAFTLWVASHFLAISVLLLAAWWFDKQSEERAVRTAHILEEIEDKRLHE